MDSLVAKISLSRLVKFTAPTIIMMLFMAFYAMIDAIFVARYVNTNALSAVNIVYPILNVVIAIGIMFASGGSAIVAKNLGEGLGDDAREAFSLIVYFGIATGVIISIFVFLFIHPLLLFLGANESIYDYCYYYAIGLLPFLPMCILQMLFQFFFVAANKPKLGLFVVILGGFSNIVLDYIFIVNMKMGTLGAGIATGIGFSIPAFLGIVYFWIGKNPSLFFVKTHFDKKIIWEACFNGSSEMVTNLSMAVTTILFNVTMMRLLGSAGVAAITIILYAEFLLCAIFIGFSSGVSPIYSFCYGARNITSLKRLFKMSISIILCFCIITFIISNFLSSTIVSIFVKSTDPVYQIALNGFKLFSWAFLLQGINIFTCALFTALSNGKASALLSFLRTFLFVLVSLLFLPNILGINGVWLAVPIAEVLSLCVAIFLIVRLNKTYFYF